MREDACAQCSLELKNTNPTTLNPSDGDALPLLLSLVERGGWLPAVRAGCVRDQKQRNGGLSSFFLFHSLAAIFAQEDDQNGTERREEVSFF